MSPRENNVPSVDLRLDVDVERTDRILDVNIASRVVIFKIKHANDALRSFLRTIKVDIDFILSKYTLADKVKVVVSVELTK